MTAQIIFALLSCSSPWMTQPGGDPKYPVQAIPEDMKANVNVVIREEVMIFKILTRSSASLHVLEAITILNEKGKDYASEVIGYDKLSKIKEFNGNVYDATGKLIKKLKSSEIRDQSSYDGFSLYSDVRLKYADLSQAVYPYTVEFEYVKEYKFLFQIPGFVVVPEEKVSVQHSQYSLQFPSGLPPRYKVFNISQSPQKGKTTEGLESISWTFENVKPLKSEPLGPPALFPKIMATPTFFKYDGYEGTMDSWDHFGQWIASLNKGRNALPEETKAKILQLTQNLKTPEEKIKAIYEYLQGKN